MAIILTLGLINLTAVQINLTAANRLKIRTDNTSSPATFFSHSIMNQVCHYLYLVLFSCWIGDIYNRLWTGSFMNKPSISDDSWSYTVILYAKKTIIASRLSMTVSFSSFLLLYMRLQSHKWPYNKNIFRLFHFLFTIDNLSPPVK